MGKKAGLTLFSVKAALWVRGGWVLVMVLVPANGRRQALTMIAELLNYHVQPINSDSGRQYLVSADSRVYMVRATSSDQARLLVGNSVGSGIKRSVWLVTVRQLTAHPHRSAPFTTALNPWKCGWCSCRDFTIGATEDQACPICGQRSNNASRQVGTAPQTRASKDGGWPPREEDPVLAGIDTFFENQPR